MEDDRAEVDVGIAADIEEAHTSQSPVRQPKKRFVGRRTADASTRGGSSVATTGRTGELQSNATK